MVIKQTSIVDVSVVEVFTAAISSSSIKPLVQSNAPFILSAAKEEKSSEPLIPSDSSSMFSASMAPPRSAQAGQKEELITTVAPTIEEDHHDLSYFDSDNLGSENPTSVLFVPQDGGAFPDPQSNRESAAGTEPVPTEQENLSVIKINTIQPDVPMLDPSLITEPMFAEGKTEETILIPEIKTATSSDLIDNPTETSEVNVEEVFSSSESMPTSVYDIDVDEIETHYGVEALPPTQPLEQDFSSKTDDINTDITTVTAPETTYTQPKATQAAPNMQTASVAAILPDSEELTDDDTLLSGVEVFDESTAKLLDHSGYTLMETDVTTEIDPEFFTSSTITAAAGHITRSPSTALKHTGRTEQSGQLTIAARLQHEGKTETWSLAGLFWSDQSHICSRFSLLNKLRKSYSVHNSWQIPLYWVDWTPT